MTGWHRPCRSLVARASARVAKFTARARRSRATAISEVALLLSMTGFGEARLQDQRWTIVVEMRTVNNRHFKLSAKISEAYATMEPALEQLVREKVKRGTVQLSLRIDRPRRPEDYRLNLVALASYRDQLQGLRGFDETARSTWRSSWPCRASSRTSARPTRRPTTTGPRSPGSSARPCEASRPRAPRKAGRWPPS